MISHEWCDEGSEWVDSGNNGSNLPKPTVGVQLIVIHFLHLAITLWKSWATCDVIELI